MSNTHIFTKEDIVNPLCMRNDIPTKIKWVVVQGDGSVCPICKEIYVIIQDHLSRKAIDEALKFILSA